MEPLYKYQQAAKKTDQILIDLSMRKWEKVIDGTGTDRGRNDCPLCIRYCNVSEGMVTKETACFGCPVKLTSKLQFCNNTPYVKWVNHQRIAHDRTADLKIECGKCKKLAIEELEFLRSVYDKYNAENGDVE